MRVTHVSIIHSAFDNRILQKQCTTLAAAGYDVHYLAGGRSERRIGGVRFLSLSDNGERPPARRQPPRLLRATRLAFKLRPSVYHLHDPHLIPLGLLLKLARQPVVYDVHEDYPAHAVTKLVGRPLRGRLKALMWRLLEAVARASFDGFVCASPALAEQFPAARTRVVSNFPVLERFAANGSSLPYRERGNTLIYSGTIMEIRGFRELLRAIELVPDDLDCRVRVLGGFRDPRLERAARALPVWDRFELCPWRPLPAVIPELLRARVGLALLHPLPNHTDAIRSNKLFEHMAAGIPTIASDLPRWREIVVGTGCGLVVDPLDARAIAEAIEYLLRHPEEAEEMGRRGREAVRERFNWRGDADRLLSFYRDLLGEPTSPRRQPIAVRSDHADPRLPAPTHAPPAPSAGAASGPPGPR
jgi:glycosyltransferase involved in cell wall biosynthesis